MLYTADFERIAVQHDVAFIDTPTTHISGAPTWRRRVLKNGVCVVRPIMWSLQALHTAATRAEKVKRLSRITPSDLITATGFNVM